MPKQRRRRTWLIWLGTVGVLSLAGAAIIARLINQPLKRLSADGQLRAYRHKGFSFVRIIQRCPEWMPK